MEDRKRETTLALRQEKTAHLFSDPHNPLRHLERGLVHEELGFFDLASADAYRALYLFETVIDPDSSEYHAKARKDSVLTGEFDQAQQACDDDDDEDGEEGNFTPTSRADYDESIGSVYRLLVRSLVKCGCMKDAYEFCIQGLDLPDELLKEDDGLKEQLRIIKQSVATKQKATGIEVSGLVDSDAPDAFDPSLLASQGFAKRVLYPWNTHEPERKSPETLELLNKMLSEVSSKCEVRAVALPALHNPLIDEQDRKMGKCSQNEESEPEVSIQLGLFAKEDIAPGEIILRESSFLTATNRLHDDFCDACNGPLPDLSSENAAVACEDCDDIIFCSSSCADVAQDIYHGAVCGQDGLASIGKSTSDPKDKADYLYLLLLGRAIAMAATQQIHPLELSEVKYIWGDFHPWDDLQALTNDPSSYPAGSTLPFSFQLNILQPMRMLEEMEIDPFSSLQLYDTWILNTLYAKFRGTASGRLSTWDGGPEVCAVHPLWCLANHSCDPNVRWEWGGEITFVAREDERRVKWKSGGDGDGGELESSGKGGIRKDEEILNHYCDVGLGVKDRREWAMGALGGACLCERCVFEAGEKS
ncbi:hypothetical protein FQN54_008253 [Arachnomyces sp. PD_36]|nr:hypothetical protein FQN54_008253 [Arachnomyces sp. PD_36]